MKTLFLYASSRPDGNTKKALEMVVGERTPNIINLSESNIGYFNYENKNAADDFIPIIEKVLTYDTIVFVSPIYWYSLSAQMKTFIDRLSDLLAFNKDLGRQLRGKSAYLITSWSTSFPEYFARPLEDTCTYLGMTFKGAYDFCADPEKRALIGEEQRAKAFAEVLFSESL